MSEHNGAGPSSPVKASDEPTLACFVLFALGMSVLGAPHEKWTRGKGFSCLFVVGRGDVAQGRMAPPGVVERLAVLEDAGPRLGPGLVVLMVAQPLLQGREETSMGALSQQLARRLMLQRIPCRARRRW